MGSVIELVSDGDGLAVIGDPGGLPCMLDPHPTTQTVHRRSTRPT